jgi:hypothetical protein
VALQLTDEQAQQIAAQKRGGENRPQYYNAALGEFRVISSDFEDVLILLTAQTKQQAIAWINELLDIGATNTDRDDVLAEAIDFEWGAVRERAEVLNDALSEFSDFKASFGVPGVSGVPEVGFLMSDMDLAVSEATEKQARATFDRRAGETTEAKRLTGEALTAGRKQQLESWISVLSAY